MTNRSFQKKHVFLLTFILFLIKCYLVLRYSTGPSILNDEYIYKFNAESLFLLQKYANSHYPPTYPLALSPALFFNRWYEAMLFINAFLSSLIIPATWILSNKAGCSKPGIPTLLSALIPFHFVYPHFLLSENLFIPLFTLSVALAINSNRASYIESLLFGAILALTHMTKYIFLPALLLLYATWALGILLAEKDNSLKYKIFKIALPLVSYLLFFGAWLLYGAHSGFNFQELLGLGISTAGRLITNSAKTVQNLTTISASSSLSMWLTAYACLVTLTWFPCWALIIVRAFQGVRTSTRKAALNPRYRLAFVTALLISGYCLISAVHSLGAKYNYPTPSKIMGRYLTQFAPLILVLTGITLEGLANPNRSLRHRNYALAVVITLATGACAWWIFIGDGIWDFPSFFYKNPINLADMQIVGELSFYSTLILSLLAPYVLSRRNTQNHFLLALPLAIFFVIQSIGYIRNTPFQQAGTTLRMIAEVASAPEYKDKAITVFSNKVRLPEKALIGAPRFWNLGKTILLKDNRTPPLPNTNNTSQISFYITDEELDMKLEKEYRIKHKNYYIYSAK